MHTIGTLAKFASGITGAAPEYHARQMRGWSQLNVLEPVRTSGEYPTITAYFDERGVCQSLIYTALVSMGLPSSSLEDVRVALKKRDTRGRVPEGLTFAMREIKAGREVYLQLGYVAWWVADNLPLKHGNPSGFITSNPEVPDDGLDKRGYIVLPLKSLLSPVLVG